MKNIHIPTSAWVSILIGVISLLVVIVNGFMIFSYYPPLDLANLSEQNIKMNQYVEGTITDCVTVPVFNSQRALRGNSGTFIKGGEIYQYYTIPISGDQYIRILINDEETIKGMERIVHGDAAEVSFVGQIQVGGPLYTEWYNWDPEFDQSKIVVEYVIWQKELGAEENFCRVGFWGIVLAVLIYYFGGGIQMIEVPLEMPKYDKVAHHYDLENELAVARRRLEMYREQERAYRKKTTTGTVCIIIGLLIIVLNVFFIRPIGFLSIFYGVKKWWNFFINSRNRYALKISSFFSIKTLQTKRAIVERKIEELEQESFTDMHHGLPGKTID